MNIAAGRRPLQSTRRHCWCALLWVVGACAPVPSGDETTTAVVSISSDDGATTTPTSTGAGDLSQSSGAASTDTGDDLCSSGMIYRPATGEIAAYCIDSTEVTVAAYGEIMNSGHVPEPIEGCGSVDGPAWYMRGEGAGEPSPQHPAGGVNWCQAHVYCAWRGKRLCGDRNGAALDVTGVEIEPALLLTTEWVAACSSHGTRDYSYGDIFDPTACPLLGDGGRVGTVPAGTTATCEGPDGVFDMSGSLWEWTNACAVGDGARHCLAMGDAATRYDGLAEPPAGACLRDSRILLDSTTPVELSWAEIGFRCCASPLV